MATEEKIEQITTEMDILINGQRDLRQLAHETQRQLQHHGELIRHLQDSADNQQRQMNNLQSEQKEQRGVLDNHTGQLNYLTELVEKIAIKLEVQVD
ncbi:hypothetical protein [Endozoicomonas ascidiicola]|uniref:hypothetical protein n=1 Tax=Endozoicomonas ascidiicola TaxID=1698521 RepID=UPI00083598F8|nr:hypothetical protein [Endozoicomonas ascidiicola]